MVQKVTSILRDAYKGNPVADLTFGLGGHTKSLIQSGVQDIITCDGDEAAIPLATQLLNNHLIVSHQHCKLSAFTKCSPSEIFDGALIDAGVSSPQLDTASSGFSFRHDGLPRMAMGAFDIFTADLFLNYAREGDLVKILRMYSDEINAKVIAKAIVKARPITGTEQLAMLVENAVKDTSCREKGAAASSLQNDASFTKSKRKKKIHPATRTMQAFRICVNDELAELELGLLRLFEKMSIGGTIAVITFHELEERVRSKVFAKVIGSERSQKGMQILEMHQGGYRRWKERQNIIINILSHHEEARKLVEENVLALVSIHKSFEKEESGEACKLWDAAGALESIVIKAIAGENLNRNDTINNNAPWDFILSSIKTLPVPSEKVSSNLAFEPLSLKPFKPNNAEKRRNPRARSASLMAYKRVA